MSSITIPITVKKYVGYKVTYKLRKQEKIIFPAKKEAKNRLLEIGRFDVEDFDHNAKFIKEHQKISVESPFCFNGNPNLKEIELNSLDKITVFISIDEIKELNDVPNIDIEYRFEFKWRESSIIPSLEEVKKSKEQMIKPYEAKAILKISFKPHNNVETKNLNSYKVSYAPEDADGYRFRLGDITIRNLQDIPYKHSDGSFEQVSLSDLHIYLTLKKRENDNELPQNVGYILNNDSYVNNSDVCIQNGEEGISFGLFLDWNKWKDADCPTVLYLRIYTDNWMRPLYKCNFKMAAQYSDGVYSLDLGTSGIVVAMQMNGEIKLVELADQEEEIKRIEKDIFILSSVSILKNKDKDESVYAELAPSKFDIYEENTHILVPAKFIVGQHSIPFLNYNDKKLKSVYAFGSKNVLDMRLTDNIFENEKVIKKFISCLYADVFSRFGKKPEDIKKMVITYPNTYTPEILKEVESILKGNLNLKSPGQILFVPESDAVAAFYFNQRIFNQGFPLEKERVIIYDMGAGTLDLSLVEFIRGDKTNNHHTARILNKIGIPIAGNYLDYIVYIGLEKFINEKGKGTHIGQIYLKDAVADFKTRIPEVVDENSTIGELTGELADISEDYLSSQSKAQIAQLSYKELLGDAFSGYLDVCSSTAIDTLLLGYEDTMPNTIVFSGRASQLMPLKKRIMEYVRTLNANIKEDTIMDRTSHEGLKVCVAEGAIKYMDLFDENSPHRIENKNQYAKVAVIYWGEVKPGKFDVEVRYLLEPNKEDWSNGLKINGTICKDFYCKVTLDNIVSGTRIYYVQTFLGESELKNLFRNKYTIGQHPNEIDHLKWGFVNILFDLVVRTKNQVIDVEFEITKNNVITKRRVGANELKDAKIIENLENNILYKYSMWPNVK